MNGALATKTSIGKSLKKCIRNGIIDGAWLTTNKRFFLSCLSSGECMPVSQALLFIFSHAASRGQIKNFAQFLPDSSGAKLTRSILLVSPQIVERSVGTADYQAIVWFRIRNEECGVVFVRGGIEYADRVVCCVRWVLISRRICGQSNNSLLLRFRHRRPQSELQPNQAAYFKLQQQKSRESCELCHPVDWNEQKVSSSALTRSNRF